MDDSWRFRSIQGNICPTCSISHFPFCPQSRSFDPSFQRPHFDPNSRSLSPIRPTGLPIDGHSSQITRNYRDGFEYEPTLNFDYSANDRTVKRIRIGEGVPGLGLFSQYNSGVRLSAEDERRLSLIRDHGAPPTIGMDSGYVSQEGNRLNGYSYESSLGDWQAGSSGLYDPRGCSRDRMLHQESALDNQNYLVRNNVFGERKEFGRWENSVGYGHQMMQSDMDGFQSGKEHMIFPNKEESGVDSSFTLPNEPRLQPHYNQNDNFRPASVPSGLPNYGTTVWSHHEEDSPGCFQREKSQQPFNSQHGLYSIPQKSHYMYHGKDPLHLQPKEFNQENEFSHSSVVSSQLPGAGLLFYENKQTLHTHRHQNDLRQSFDVKHPPMDDFHTSIGLHNSSMPDQFGTSKVNEHERGTYLPISTGNSMVSVRQVDELNSREVGVYPPLPQSGDLGVYPPLPSLPPPSLPMEPPGPPPVHVQARVSPPTIPLTSSDRAPPLHPSSIEGRHLPPKNTSPDKPKIIDASSLFKRPSRDTRPDHIVVILRGLPGSGKSYLAKMLRDLEVENGANAPRIHSMDDYFVTEVEKVEESEVSKSSGTSKNKKRVTKKVMEYCYEPEMEVAYRLSMLKAFKKTLEDGEFTFVIVDDRNLRIADFAQFWASAKRCGYEVYLLEAMYKDPVGCAARNIHGFTSDDIQKMAELWEDAPSLYLRLDIQSLFHGDDLEEHGILEVDMDMDTDDVACEGQSGLQNRVSLKTEEAPEDHFSGDSLKDEERSDVEGDDPGLKQLGRSKWSNDAEEENTERSERAFRDSNALSGLIHAYTKGDQSVHWGDQVDKTGFSIGANKRAKVLSLVIGPGAGYNLKSNPLPEEENEVTTDISWQAKKRSVFEEQLRAERASERESFKSSIDRRRPRIGGFGIEDDS